MSTSTVEHSVDQRHRGPIRLIAPADDPPMWDAYVARHPKGSIFHTERMVNVLAATPKNHPWAKAAVDQSGKIVALATAVRIETIGGLASRLASRSIWYAEPICDDSHSGEVGLARLIDDHDHLMRGRILFTEVRANFAPNREQNVLIAHGYKFLDYLNYVVDLQDHGNLEKNLSKSCRKQIRKCRKAGVTIDVRSDHDAIEEMYKLVQYSYGRSKVPLASVHLFHAALDRLERGVVEIRLAKLAGKTVAGGIVLKSHDTVYAWYGGAYRVTGLAPFALLTWDEIECGSREGFKFYDFGGAGWPDEEYGPREFKSKFGGQLVRHGRYRRVNSALKLAAASGAYNIVRALKSLLPHKYCQRSGGN